MAKNYENNPYSLAGFLEGKMEKKGVPPGQQPANPNAGMQEQIQAILRQNPNLNPAQVQEILKQRMQGQQQQQQSPVQPRPQDVQPRVQVDGRPVAALPQRPEATQNKNMPTNNQGETTLGQVAIAIAKDVGVFYQYMPKYVVKQALGMNPSKEELKPLDDHEAKTRDIIDRNPFVKAFRQTFWSEENATNEKQKGQNRPTQEQRPGRPDQNRISVAPREPQVRPPEPRPARRTRQMTPEEAAAYQASATDQQYDATLPGEAEALTRPNRYSSLRAATLETPEDDLMEQQAKQRATMPASRQPQQPQLSEADLEIQHLEELYRMVPKGAMGAQLRVSLLEQINEAKRKKS